MGLALALGLGSRGSLGMLRVPQALEEAPRFFITIPRDMFSFRAGQGWADSFFLFSFFFFKSSGGQCQAAELGGGSWLILLGSA